MYVRSIKNLTLQKLAQQSYHLNKCIAYVPPFTNTAVDFAKSLYVKNSEHVNKIYVCLFTCVTTQAIHLELTTSLGAP